jgi:hypothetical protein
MRQGHIDRAVVSPSRDLIAYAFRDHYPHDQQEVWALHPPSVIVTDWHGTHLDSIANSSIFAWSPSGIRLAALSPTHYESGIQPMTDTLILWSAESRTRKAIIVPRARDGLEWVGEDSLMVGNALIPRTGGHALPGRKLDHASFSSDRRFTFSGSPESGGFSLLDRKYGTNLGWLLLHEVGLESMRGAGAAAWVPGARSGHLLAFSTWDSVLVRSGQRRLSYVTHWVDVKAMRVIQRTPGIQLGVSGDKTAIFDEHGLKFVSTPESGRSEERYAPTGPPGTRFAFASGPRMGGSMAPRIPGVDLSKTEIILVQPGQWVSCWDDDHVFRVLRTLPSGEVLAEAGPEWGVPGAGGAGARPLVLLSGKPRTIVRFFVIDAWYRLDLSLVENEKR